MAIACRLKPVSRRHQFQRRNSFNRAIVAQSAGGGGRDAARESRRMPSNVLLAPLYAATAAAQGKVDPATVGEEASKRLQEGDVLGAANVVQERALEAVEEGSHMALARNDRDRTRQAPISGNLAGERRADEEARALAGEVQALRQALAEGRGQEEVAERKEAVRERLRTAESIAVGSQGEVGQLREALDEVKSMLGEV